jgi:transposase
MPIDSSLGRLGRVLTLLLPAQTCAFADSMGVPFRPPAHLPRHEIHHDPENTTCSCNCALKRIGEDVAWKLD